MFNWIKKLFGNKTLTPQDRVIKHLAQHGLGDASSISTALVMPWGEVDKILIMLEVDGKILQRSTRSHPMCISYKLK